jgi:hypothetical protein
MRGKKSGRFVWGQNSKEKQSPEDIRVRKFGSIAEFAGKSPLVAMNQGK